MNKQAYKSIAQLSLGEVSTSYKPSREYKDDSHRQMNDAILAAAHSPLVAWVVDNTTESESTGGKQEKIRRSVESSSGQKIGDFEFSVPTTTNFVKALFEGLVDQKLVPKIQEIERSYASLNTSRPSGQSSSTPSALAQQSMSDTLDEIKRTTPKQLQRTR